MQARRVKVTRHGQTTLPKEFRDALGVREGSEVLVQLEGESIRIRPLPRLEDLAGSLSRYGRYSEWVKDLEREEEEEE